MTDRLVVFEAVKQCPWALAFASSDLQNDKELVMFCASKFYGSLFYFASKELKEGGLLEYVHDLALLYNTSFNTFMHFLFGLKQQTK